mmetsp:Transcript_28725/g.72117  ORF Transcript_28725/g.72117 Transcript_28725/m.72117 type:complete len:250 (+) Transcript_28725:1156-1905(+)
MPPTQNLQDQPRVRIRLRRFTRLRLFEPILIVKVHFRHRRRLRQPRGLHIHLEVNRLFRLESHHELVRRRVFRFGKEVVRRGWALELHANFGLALVEGFPRAHDERHAGPPRVADVEDDGGKGRGHGVVGNAVVVTVARAVLAVDLFEVLPENDVFDFDRLNALQDLDLLVTEKLRAALARDADRRLHGDDGEDLEKVILHDVANDADAVKVSPAPIGTKVLFEVDGNRLNVVPVPDRLEHGVCETQRH